MLTEQANTGDASFVTLTYDDDCLPVKYQPELGEWIPTLEKSHAKNWLQSVRRKATDFDISPRFFMAGEYGSKTGRPHLHCILFGIGPTWESLCAPAWKYGFQSWYPGSVRSMAYVAKYCLKHGRDPELESVDSESRVTVAPFRRMSRNPPIGGDLAARIAAAAVKKGGPEQLLKAEKELAGVVRIGRDSYPIDRTIRDRIDKHLDEDYGVEQVYRDAMLNRESYEPTEIEIANAKAAHIRAVQNRNKRDKL